MSSLLNRTDARMDAWLEPVSADLANPLYAETSYVIPDNVTLISFQEKNGTDSSSVSDMLVGFLRDADALFGQALAQPQYRGTARSLLARGLCLARAGQWLQAEGVLIRGYELEPNNPSMAINLAEVLYRRADYERARVFVGRVNSQPLSANPQTLWLAARIEHKLGSLAREREFGLELISRFPKSPEAALYEGRRFDE